jgi:hypothetical protein
MRAAALGGAFGFCLVHLFCLGYHGIIS